MRVKGDMRRINPTSTSFARKLRTNNTEVEKVLWYNLRNRQLKNIKFRRQYAIGKYIVDFVSLEKKLIIEIDGGQHNEEINKKDDDERTAWLNSKGYRVLRFWNNEILENIEGVVESIIATLHPHPDPLPKREREQLEILPKREREGEDIPGREREGLDERLYWLGFGVFSGIGPIRFKRLLDHFGTARAAWEARIEDLRKGGLGEKTAKRFEIFRKNFSVSDYFEKLQKAGVGFFTLNDHEYPQLLAGIKNPPIVLFVKGDYKILNQQIPKQVRDDKFVAVVGTRKITSYGSQVTDILVRELVGAGCIIVSGLAIGVDSRAHGAALESKGKTIAVLGSGVDVCSPATNLYLYRKILENGGAIVSEFTLGQIPMRGAFPSRNRIIAGLCEGVVVTEGASDSGALITAEDAFENGRKVFAVPGPITSDYSKAPNSLLAKGAIPVSSAADILEALGFTKSIPTSPRLRGAGKGETREERAIIDLLQSGEFHVDELIRKTNIHASKIGTILSLMEMKGLVKNLGSGIFGLGS